MGIAFENECWVVADVFYFNPLKVASSQEGQVQQACTGAVGALSKWDVTNPSTGRVATMKDKLTGGQTMKWAKAGKGKSDEGEKLEKWRKAVQDMQVEDWPNCNFVTKFSSSLFLF